jgi:hypothetical protein
VIFDQPVSVTTSAQVQFGSGTYWFKDGLTLGKGNNAVTFGTGTYIFGQSSSNTCPTTGCLDVSYGSVLGPSSAGEAGALFYVENGAVNFVGNGQVTLQGEPSNYGVALWDAAPASTPANNITVTNSGSADSLGGIYSPNNQVVITGSSPVNIAFLVANNVSMSSGGGDLSVG